MSDIAEAARRTRVRVTVEVLGVVRDLVGGPFEELVLPEPGTTRQALGLLAALYPGLVGPVLEADGCTPNAYYLVNLEGRQFVQDLDEPLPEDSHLVLMSAIGGG